MGFSALGSTEEVCSAPVEPREKSSTGTFLWNKLDAALEHLLQGESGVAHLPRDISRAAVEGNKQAVLEWLGAPPVASMRLEATYRGRTLLHEAVGRNQVDLASQLLRLGANVESKNALGFSPLEQALCQEDSDEMARLLLTWGARIDPRDVVNAQNRELVQLLQDPLGGRRCEIVGLKVCPHFNGKTGVVVQLMPEDNLLVFQLEETDQVFTVQAANLKRRDRTPMEDLEESFRFPSIAPRTSGNPMEEWGIIPSGCPQMPMFEDDFDVFDEGEMSSQCSSPGGRLFKDDFDILGGDRYHCSTPRVRMSLET